MIDKNEVWHWNIENVDLRVGQTRRPLTFPHLPPKAFLFLTVCLDSFIVEHKPDLTSFSCWFLHVTAETQPSPLLPVIACLIARLKLSSCYVNVDLSTGAAGKIARKFIVLRMQLRAGRPSPRAKRPVADAAAESWWESRKTCCCFRRLLFVIFS